MLSDQIEQLFNETHSIESVISLLHYHCHEAITKGMSDSETLTVIKQTDNIYRFFQRSHQGYDKDLFQHSMWNAFSSNPSFRLTLFKYLNWRTY